MCELIKIKSPCGKKVEWVNWCANRDQDGHGIVETERTKWQGVEGSGTDPSWMCKPTCGECNAKMHPKVEIEVAVSRGRKRNDRDRKANGTLRANGDHPPVAPPTSGIDADRRQRREVWPGNWQVTPTGGFHGVASGQEVQTNTASQPAFEGTSDQASQHSASDQGTLMDWGYGDTDQTTLMDRGSVLQYPDGVRVLQHRRDQVTQRRGYSYSANGQGDTQAN